MALDHDQSDETESEENIFSLSPILVNVMCDRFREKSPACDATTSARKNSFSLSFSWLLFKNAAAIIVYGIISVCILCKMNYDFYYVVSLIMCVAYDVCRLIMFVAYDVCRLIMHIANDVCRL